MLKPIFISFIVFAFLLVGALLGMAYRAYLTKNHLSQETKEYVLTVGLELAGVIAAFVLALAVTGAQENYTEQRDELIADSAKVVLLHKILVNYGPESIEARDILHRSLVNTIDNIDKFWPSGNLQPIELEVNAKTPDLYEKILLLNPQNEAQRSLKKEALDISFNLEQSADMLIMHQNKSITVQILIWIFLLVIWFVFIFFSLGIYAPSNSTAILILVISALSVSIAFFMIVDLNLPFEGVLRLTSTPLREALQYIGK
jgi:hypothetical protein